MIRMLPGSSELIIAEDSATITARNAMPSVILVAWSTTLSISANDAFGMNVLTIQVIFREMVAPEVPSR
jgi:hypothetical protein